MALAEGVFAAVESEAAACRPLFLFPDFFLPILQKQGLQMSMQKASGHEALKPTDQALERYNLEQLVKKKDEIKSCEQR